MVEADLLSRIEALERHNFMLKRWGSVLLVAGVAAAVMGQAFPVEPPEVIRANRFEVLDSRGQIQVAVGGDKARPASIAVYDPKGTERLTIGLTAGPTKDTRSVLLALYRQDGEEVLSLTDSPRLHMWGTGTADILELGWVSEGGFLTFGGEVEEAEAGGRRFPRPPIRHGTGLRMFWPSEGSSVPPAIEMVRGGKTILKVPE